MNDTTQLIHVVAVVNDTDGSGKILYVNPSNVRSHSDTEVGMQTGAVKLILRDGNGARIGEHTPNVRYSACDGEEEEIRQGLIQEDIQSLPGLASIDLVRGTDVLDTFVAQSPIEPGDVAAGLSLGRPNPGAEHTREFGAKNLQPRAGTSYVIQARPDTGGDWQTLAVGRPTPEFTIDKNQFPSASAVDIRVIQNAGFERRIIDERKVSLEDD